MAEDDIMEGSWWIKMILSILTLCNDESNDTNKEGMEYDNDNYMVKIIQSTKKAKGKQNKIIDELVWTKETRRIAEQYHNNAGKQCKEDNDCYVECDEDCTSGE